MRLLLDTHVFLWSLLEPTRLKKRVRAILANPDNEIWLSPITVWEIVTLCRKGKLALQPDANRWLAAAFSQVHFKQAPLTHEVALATEKVGMAHHDPAARFLAATARVNGLTLVTSDENLLKGTGFQVLANR